MSRLRACPETDTLGFFCPCRGRGDDPDVDVEREDIVEQIENYRELFETLLAERPPP